MKDLSNRERMGVMDTIEVQQLRHGLYIIHWKSGGSSLASVGSFASGQRWVAPSNWVSFINERQAVDIWETIESVEALYDRTAPLIRREFPEALFIAQLHGFYLLCRVEELSMAVERTLPDFKRLFEGDHIAEVGENVGLRPDAQDEKNRQASQGLARIEDSKKVCQTCGGSERVETDGWDDCPACTGECQHKDVMGIEGVSDKFYCCDCQQDLKTRRIRKERRKGLEARAWLTLEHEMAKGIFTEAPGIRGMRKNWLLDRRTLNDRRKQTSDDA